MFYQLLFYRIISHFSVIAPEAKNILIRHFYQHAEEKVSNYHNFLVHLLNNCLFKKDTKEKKNRFLGAFITSFLLQLRTKRASCDNPTPGRASKIPRAASPYDDNL